jgi:hypothetical protein
MPHEVKRSWLRHYAKRQKVPGSMSHEVKRSWLRPYAKRRKVPGSMPHEVKRSWLRHYATRRKVPGSMPLEATVYSSLTMAQGLCSQVPQVLWGPRRADIQIGA